MSCVKIFLQSIVAQKGTNILIFYIFEYGAKYGAESGAEEFFILSADNVKNYSSNSCILGK